MKFFLSLVVLFCVLASSGPARAAASGKSLEEHFSIAQTAFKENRLDEAADNFTIVAEKLAAANQPDKARAIYNNVAVIRIKQEKWQDGYDVYVKALALKGPVAPDFLKKAVGNMAFCADKAGRHDLKAEAIARLFAAKVPLEADEHLNFLSMQGDAYRAGERYALACQSYEKALALPNVPADKLPLLLTSLGLCQGNLGRYPQALQSLEKALAAAKAAKAQLSIVEAGSNIGIIYWEMGQYDKAVQYLGQAMQDSKTFNLRRNEGVDSNNLGLVYKNAGQIGVAVNYVDAALAIAREVKNRRDEAIALSNRALLSRMKGQFAAARQDYNEALAIYREVAFTEGEASSLMGLARIDVLKDRNYLAALDKLNRAAAIYEKLGNPGFLAECYVQLGQAYQKLAAPDRKTRDLIFDDEDEIETGTITPAEALAKSGEYFDKARKLAEQTGRKEMLWGSLHGLAFAAREKNDLNQAEKHYAQAIQVVLSMKGAEEKPDLLLEFLRSKDDLFAEAMDVCARLYEQTKNPDLLRKQLEYDEIYRNEVMRANMKTASLAYEDPAKKSLYDDVVRLSASKKKAEDAARRAGSGSGETARAESILSSQDATVVAREFESKLAQWKSSYPADAVLFDSVASVDLNKLRGNLGADQAILQYLPLEDSLIIMVVTRESVDMKKVAVSYQKLAELIRDQFIARDIEFFGHSGQAKINGETNICYSDEGGCYEQALKDLETMYSWLYAPVAAQLENKPRLYIVTSKYLSYVPFAALISSRSADRPHFLVEDKIITLSRLSFLSESLGAAGQRAAAGSIIAVGDPVNQPLEVVLGRLDGAQKEARDAVEAVKAANPSAKTVLLVDSSATKSAWRSSLQNNKYSIFYFATHGVPFAEMQHDSAKIAKSVRKAEADGRTSIAGNDLGLYKDFLSYYGKTFPNNSHLNGFLFMAYPDSDSGVLTLKDILEMPDSSFDEASLAVLSACNTAVSYSPKVIKSNAAQLDLESKEAAAELAAAGWTPGVDQVCLTDTFMKKKFRNVYGTLWFADDLSSSIIMSRFMANLQTLPPAEALRDAQLEYLKNPPAGNPPAGVGDYPLHPFFWACGNIFGQ